MTTVPKKVRFAEFIARVAAHRPRTTNRDGIQQMPHWPATVHQLLKRSQKPLCNQLVSVPVCAVCSFCAFVTA